MLRKTNSCFALISNHYLLLAPPKTQKCCQKVILERTERVSESESECECEWLTILILSRDFPSFLPSFLAIILHARTLLSGITGTSEKLKIRGVSISTGWVLLLDRSLNHHWLLLPKAGITRCILISACMHEGSG